jgi:pyruvate dehydrogenase E2 component (dihydrolipoamide acetyltransferase)
MANIDIQVPDIGVFDEVTVIELLVKPCDTVKAEQSSPAWPTPTPKWLGWA